MTSVAFSRDGKRLFTGGADVSEVSVFFSASPWAKTGSTSAANRNIKQSDSERMAVFIGLPFRLW